MGDDYDQGTQGTGDTSAVSDGGGGTSLRDGRARQVWLRLTGAPGGTGADYPWVQLDESDPTFPDLTNSLYPLAGTALSMPAREVTGNAFVPYGPTGAKVRADLSADESCYIFIYATGSGTGSGSGSGSFSTVTITVVTAVCPVFGYFPDGTGS